MSSEAQVALIVGIVSAVSALVGALGGTALGWWLNKKSERRGEKRAAFVELLSAMDECQQVCTVLSVLVAGGKADPELAGPRSHVIAAMHRVGTAGNLAMLAVSPEHEEVLRRGPMACVEELRNANHGTDTTGITEAKRPILELGRRELR